MPFRHPGGSSRDACRGDERYYAAPSGREFRDLLRRAGGPTPR